MENLDLWKGEIPVTYKNEQNIRVKVLVSCKRAIYGKDSVYNFVVIHY